MNGPSPFAITTKSSSNNGLLVGLGCEYDWTLARKYLSRRSMRSHSPCSARWKLRCCYLQYATTSFFHPSLITITKKSPLISRQSKLRPAFWSWLNKERPRYLNFNSYEGFYYLSLCMKGFFYGTKYFGRKCQVFLRHRRDSNSVRLSSLFLCYTLIMSL